MGLVLGFVDKNNIIREEFASFSNVIMAWQV